MTSAESVTVLLISDCAEDVKQLTVGMRAHFPGCQVEAVYTTDQALEWTSRYPWTIIVLDLELPDSSGLMLAQKLRQLRPESAIILYSVQREISALQAMRSGAAALLHRRTPTFLHDALKVSGELLRSPAPPEMPQPGGFQDLQEIEAGGAILYELNADGQFTYLSTGVHDFLGYDAQELLGTHYSKLLHTESRRLAEQRFNERRAGARATRKLELRLLPKASIGPVPDPYRAEISAKGVYAAPEMFLGTVGMIRREPWASPASPVPQRAAPPATLTLPAPVATAPRRHPLPSGQPPTIETIWRTVEYFLGRLDVVSPAESWPRALRARSEALVTASAPRPASAGIPPPASTPVATAPDAPPAGPAGVTAPEPRPLKARRVDRRRIPRKSVRLATETLVFGDVWKGVTINLSRSGLCTRLPPLPHGLASHPVIVSLVSDVLFLQLSGRATTDQRQNETLLRIHFEEIEEVKRVVLQSFLEVLNEQPEYLKVQIHLSHVPPRTEPTAKESIGITNAVVAHERRFDFRVPCHIPVHLFCRTADGVTTRCSGTLLDLHLRGARVRALEGLRSRDGACFLQLPAPEVFHSGVAFPEASETSPNLVPVQVIREIEQGAADPARASLTWNYGVQFGFPNEKAAARLAEYVDHAVLSFMGGQEARDRRKVSTDLLFTHNTHDRRIAIYHDYSNGETPVLTPIVVIAPDLGRPKEEYLHLAYFLASQGFHVLRYDPTNHVGESDGHDGLPLLSQMQSDLTAVLEFVEEFWPGTPLLLLGDGIGGRLCARSVGSDWWVVALAMLNPPLDLSEELHTLQHTAYDPMESVGPRHGLGLLRSVRVLTEAFLQDALMSRYVSSHDLLQDLSEVTLPVALFAQLDEAARQQEVLDHFRATLGPAWRTITFVSDPQSVHLRIPPDPETWAYKLAQFFLTETRHGHPSADPSPTSMVDVNLEYSLELQRVRCRSYWTRADRKRHWLAFAKRSHRLTQTSQYRRAIQTFLRALDPMRSEHRILDIGCGNGETASALLTHWAHHPNRADWSFRLPEYVGLDLSAEMLVSAHAQVLALQSSLSREGYHLLFGGRTLAPLFVQGELQGGMPFPPGRFDTVFVSLLFGHLLNPLLAIQECARVLALGGRLLMIVPKWTADLPRWYREAILSQIPPGQIGPDEELLHEILCDFQRGWLEGALHRFSYQDLVALLTYARLTIVSIDSALDDQVFVVFAQKASFH